jgi:hypothetical protein
MRIDETREHELLRGIDQFRIRRRRKIAADLGDRLAVTQNICRVLIRGGCD